MSKCTATSKRTHERCGAQAMRGMSVCYHHGGRSLKGVASPRYKDGSRSKYMPVNMRKDYLRALNDPQLLELRRDIALSESRLLDVLKRVNAGESGRLWKLLNNCYQEMLDARRANDGVLVAARLNQLGDLIQRGIADYAAWGEVREVIESGRKLRETERKMLVAERMMITNEKAMSLMGAVADMVKTALTTHVPDPMLQRAVLIAISDGMGRLLMREDAVESTAVVVAAG